MEINSLNKEDLSGIIIPYMLPEDFKVYVKDGVVVNWPYPGFEEITLPTYNDYYGRNGGYMAMYTRDPELGCYCVGEDAYGKIYVMGQVRVPGHYEGRIFKPSISDEAVREICEKYFPGLESDFWVGGDTGGWFGIQK